MSRRFDKRTNVFNPNGRINQIEYAIKAIKTPVIEVHLSNPHTRERFRHKSYVGEAAKGTIAGFGALSYALALDAAAKL